MVNVPLDFIVKECDLQTIGFPKIEHDLFLHKLINEKKSYSKLIK